MARSLRPLVLCLGLVLAGLSTPSAQRRDGPAAQAKDADFAARVQEWTTRPEFLTPLVFHDNNRDINYSQVSMRALLEWYLQWHPPVMHDLHESVPFLYTFSGQAPQNPSLDPILYGELPMFANFEMAQLTKYGLPGVWADAARGGEGDGRSRRSVGGGRARRAGRAGRRRLGRAGGRHRRANRGANALVTLRYRVKDVKVRAADAAFTVGESSYPAGSLLIDTNQPGHDVRALVTT